MKKKLFVLFVALVLAILTATSAVAEGYDAYFYTYDGQYKESASVYTPVTALQLEDNLGVKALNPSDVYSTDSGLVYVLDTAEDNTRILIYDGNNNYEYLRQIVSFSNPFNGDPQDVFKNPGGIHVLEDGTIYVADTGNERVVVIGENDTATMVIEDPQGTGITEDFIFQPKSVAVDVMGNVYVVSNSSNMGLLVFNVKGEFQSFLGAQSVTLSSSEAFWRMLQTAAQRQKSAKQLPANYDSVAIDGDFLYVTSSKIDGQKQYSALTSKSTASDYAPIKKLNPSGDDVLRRAGFYPPAGDIALSTNTGADINSRVSRFIDCEINNLGMYTAIDTTNNHIFTYDTNGNLLCAFGGSGSSLGKFSTVTAVSYCKEDLLVLDKNNARVTVYTLTDFGKGLFEALTLQENREYAAALKKYEELLPLNANMDFVYVNMGKAYMKDGKYDLAMEYFKNVGAKEEYSKAYKLARESTLNKIAIFIPFVAIAFVALLAWVLKKIAAVNKVDDMDSLRVYNLGHEVLYAFRLLTNPIDGAYELKRSKRGSVKGASIILALAALTMLIDGYFSGYLHKAGSSDFVNPITVVLGIVLPVVVFGIGNWCVTSLMYGNGSFRDIYCVTCYALLPIILFIIPTSLISNVLTIEEGTILTFIESIAYIWSIMLIFLGVMTIHGYSLFKNIIGVVISLIAMLVIVFLVLLVVILTFRIYSFADNLITEISYRI